MRSCSSLSGVIGNSLIAVLFLFANPSKSVRIQLATFLGSSFLLSITLSKYEDRFYIEIDRMLLDIYVYMVRTDIGALGFFVTTLKLS